MKPNFALDLSHEGIGLFHRTKGGWTLVGTVALDDPALPDKIDMLRKTAVDLSPSGLTCKLIIPESQILFTTLTAPGPDDITREVQIRAGLEGLTPYAVGDLVFDWQADGDQVHVAVLTRDTLTEAEAFAAEHRMNPISFVARGKRGTFAGEAFFGKTGGAAALLGPARQVERDRKSVPLQEGAAAAMPPGGEETPAEMAQEPAVDPTPAPTPKPQPERTPDPQPAPQPGPVSEQTPEQFPEPDATSDEGALDALLDSVPDPTPASGAEDATREAPAADVLDPFPLIDAVEPDAPAPAPRSQAKAPPAAPPTAPPQPPVMDDLLSPFPPTLSDGEEAAPQAPAAPEAPAEPKPKKPARKPRKAAKSGGKSKAKTEPPAAEAEAEAAPGPKAQADAPEIEAKTEPAQPETLDKPAAPPLPKASAAVEAGEDKLPPAPQADALDAPSKAPFAKPAEDRAAKDAPSEDAPSEDTSGLLSPLPARAEKPEPPKEDAPLKGAPTFASRRSAPQAQGGPADDTPTIDPFKAAPAKGTPSLGGVERAATTTPPAKPTAAPAPGSPPVPKPGGPLDTPIKPLASQEKGDSPAAAPVVPPAPPKEPVTAAHLPEDAPGVGERVKSKGKAAGKALLSAARKGVSKGVKGAVDARDKRRQAREAKASAPAPITKGRASDTGQALKPAAPTVPPMHRDTTASVPPSAAPSTPTADAAKDMGGKPTGPQDTGPQDQGGTGLAGALGAALKGQRGTAGSDAEAAAAAAKDDTTPSGSRAARGALAGLAARGKSRTEAVPGGKAPDGKVPGGKDTASDTAIAPPPPSEADSMTVFGARQSQKVGGKPRYLGLALTLSLLLAMAVAAVWSMFSFSDGPEARFDQPDAEFAAELAPEPELLPSPEEIAPEPEPDQPSTPERPPEPTPATPPTPEVAEPIPAPAPTPAPLDQAAAEARYAATGIWERAPEAAPAPGSERINDLYIASIDPEITGRDPVALPRLGGEAQTGRTAIPAAPAPPGTTFDLDDRGLVRATPEGALSPEGITVTAGRPDVVPGRRPGTAPATDPDPAQTEIPRIRPTRRPADLLENNERASLGGLSRTELAALRPTRRPAAIAAAAAAAAAGPDADAVAGAVDEALATPEEALASATASAVASSPTPNRRPANFDRIVARAEDNSDGSVAVAASAATTPSIPTSASVADQATIDGALNLRRVNLIGVYGASNARRALVRLPSGRFVKVSVGDRLDGGRVKSISATKLIYQKGSRNVTLEVPPLG